MKDVPWRRQTSCALLSRAAAASSWTALSLLPAALSAYLGDEVGQAAALPAAALR